MRVPSLSQIVEIADGLFPFESAESWDNCGIQIGEPARRIHSVAFSLDPIPATIQFAADHSCDLLITHHPILLEPIRNLIPATLPGRTLLHAARLGVDVMSLHTNLDAAPGGLNDELATILGLQEVSTPLPARCARMGTLTEPVSLQAFAQTVSQALDIPHLRLVSDGEREVRRVFCVSGSGMGYLKEALSYDVDVMVTGDVRYHQAREAAGLGMAVIDAGHYGLEKIAVPLLVRSFRSKFHEMGLEVSCICCDAEGEPFQNIYNPQGGFSGERATTTA